MKKLLLLVWMVLFFNSGCSFLCRIPEEVKRAEELQYKQSLRIKEYLQAVNQNPQILIDPTYKKLNKVILGASESLVESTKAQSDYLGHTEEFEQEMKELEQKGGNKNGQ